MRGQPHEMTATSKLLGHKQETATPIAEDNRGAIEWVKNEIDHKRTKHIDVKYHYVRQLHEEGILSIHKEDTRENRADPFTKALTHADFERHMSTLMVDIHPITDEELEELILAHRGKEGC